MAVLRLDLGIDSTNEQGAVRKARGFGEDLVEGRFSSVTSQKFLGLYTVKYLGEEDEGIQKVMLALEVDGGTVDSVKQDFLNTVDDIFDNYEVPIVTVY